MTGDLMAGREKIRELIESDDFISQHCKHSYGRLTRTISELNVFKLNPANAARSSNFNAYALMDSKNEIWVELLEFNDSKIEEFKRHVNRSSAIAFKKSSGVFKDEVAYLNPGCSAPINAAGTSYGSYAFRAERTSDGLRGMVTAGHVLGVGGVLYNNGVAIGTCVASQNSGSVDAAFIPISNIANYTPSNSLCGTTTVLSTATSLPGAGTACNMVGATTGSASGTIISTNATITFSGGTLTNMTSADYTSAPGDSGGIIYTYVSSTNTRYSVGIHKGAVGSTKYFTKASLALSALGLARY